MSQRNWFVAICVLVLAAFLGTWYTMRHRGMPSTTQPDMARSAEPAPPTTRHVEAEFRAASPDEKPGHMTPRVPDDQKPAETTTEQPTTPAPEPPPSPETGTIHGVVRVNGEPTDGYHVLGQCQGVQREADTDANGAFTFKEIPAGSAYFLVRGKSGATASSKIERQVEVTADALTEVAFDFVEGTSTLDGIVTLNAEPLANTVLSLVVQVDGQTITSVGSSTDAQGVYRFEQLPAGTAFVRVQRSNNPFEGPIFEAILTEGAANRLDIEIAAAARVAGQIVGNPKGWQLRGALVRGPVPMPQPDLETLQRLVLDRVVIGGTMSEDGVYELDGIPPGKYTAIVWTMPPAGDSEGFKQAGGEVTIEEGDDIVQLDLTLE